jgi:hypothetical protein
MPVEARADKVLAINANEEVGMRATVVYESIYGNTRQVAEAIAEGLRASGKIEADPVSVQQAAGTGIADADLLVVGGPTHMHGMTSSLSRKLAVKAAEDEGMSVEEGADTELGLRAWLKGLSGGGTRAAAFDTRGDASPTLTGMAARGIARRLRRQGFELIADRESYLVEESEGPLASGEVERARAWGEALAGKLG